MRHPVWIDLRSVVSPLLMALILLMAGGLRAAAATASGIPAATPAVATRTPTGTPTATAAATPTVTAAPTGAPAATPTGTPNPTATPTGTPTSTPSAGSTPSTTPTKTAVQARMATPWPTSSPTATPFSGVAEQRIALHTGWNWFSFAVAPAASPHGGTPVQTARFRDYSGSVTVSGRLAPAGSVVEAFSPRGDLVGASVVARPGWYGYLRVYGEDAAANPPIPGMRTGEAVTFRVDGCDALPVGSAALWRPDPEPVQVDLAAKRALPVAEALASLTLPDGSSAYSFVLGEEGAYAAPPAPAFLNTLGYLEPGKGYFLRMGQGMELIVRGEPVPVGSRIDLRAGWRWIGYLPREARGLPEALGSLGGQLRLPAG